MCEYIGDGAFVNSNFSEALNLPVCEQIGEYAFVNSNFSDALSLPACTYIGDGAFYYSIFSGSLNLPACTYIGDRAFYNSNFTQITIGANATLGGGCIGDRSTTFINDYNANGKLAGTYVWDSVSQHWIYQ